VYVQGVDETRREQISASLILHNPDSKTAAQMSREAAEAKRSAAVARIRAADMAGLLERGTAAKTSAGMAEKLGENREVVKVVLDLQQEIVGIIESLIIILEA